MKLRLLCIGRRMPAWIDEGTAEFLKRCGRQFPVSLDLIDPAPRKGGLSDDALRAADSSRLLERVRDQERLIALDEGGKQWTTREFASRIEEWQMEGRDVCFVIGGPNGHDAALLARADQRLSLSKMTMPHGLARLVLAEQLYRAWTVISGHPYHRD